MKWTCFRPKSPAQTARKRPPPDHSVEYAERERVAKIEAVAARKKKEAADAERRAAEAQLESNKAAAEHERLVAKRVQKESRGKLFDIFGQFFRLLCRIPKLVWLIIVFALIVIPAIGSIVHTLNQPVSVRISSNLTKISSLNRLATARFSYEGIAKKKNNKKEVEYHVFYKADVEASADMSKIDFSDIDEESKTIYPKLPEIELKPNVDDTSFEFFERNPKVSTKDVLTICRKDAAKEIEKSSNIKEVAEGNLQSAVEALADPILETEGYTISWEKPVKKAPADSAAKEKSDD